MPWSQAKSSQIKASRPCANFQRLAGKTKPACPWAFRWGFDVRRRFPVLIRST
jgi:hypothetical protein